MKVSTSKPPTSDELANKRFWMVESQLRARDISDERVLAAFERVPRHEFVDKEFRDSAYGDFPLPIGQDQTISQPYIVALMTQALELKGQEVVLEVGTGSGYQAAILSLLCKKVYTIERIPQIVRRAKTVLAKLKYNNVEVIEGDGTLGYQSAAPYDRLIVTASSYKIPQPLADQLKDGGIMVIPIGNPWGQTLIKVRKRDGKLEHEDLCGCLFVPLVGKEGWDTKNAL
ncbi:protein-L-isoaspartate(D-aspartate) O-methyltransferase [Candidatus Woesearchaeota archaeon]|nr:protein-L-isoaspartate(D-aspartate) O-methyltransferase [Candidatus Woesearchaeota archaeon]